MSNATDSTLARRVVWVAISIGLLFLVGTVGYVVLEGWSIGEAAYMTVITLGTVGYGEVRPLTVGGRTFTAALIILGVGTVAYGFSVTLDYVLNAELTGKLRKRRMIREVGKLEKHVLLCGYGRVGQFSAEALRSNKQPVVILDNRPERVELAKQEGFLALQGDATQDELLRVAGVERAAGMLVCTGDDARNLFIVLSARSMNRDLMIIVRSIEPENHTKMMRAGADRVISPYQIGGRRMANAFLRPNVTDFFEGLTLDSGQEVWIEEIVVQANSPLEGQTNMEANLRQRIGVTLLGILSPSGLSVPNANTRFSAEDRLIAVGTQSQLESLESLSQTKSG